MAQREIDAYLTRCGTAPDRPGGFMTRDDTTQIRELKLVLPGVLIVDDDPLVAGHLKDLVSGAGFDARTAHSGAAALEALQQEFVPIVVLDRKMPNVDGLGV